MRAPIGDEKVLSVPGLDFPENTAWISDQDQEIHFLTGNQAHATVGCNSLTLYIGWDTDVGSIAFGDVAVTQMGCGGGDEREARFTGFLEAVTDLTWDDRALTLTTLDGESIVFSPLTTSDTSPTPR